MHVLHIAYIFVASASAYIYTSFFLWKYAQSAQV